MGCILERLESLKIGNWRDQRDSNQLVERPGGLGVGVVTCLHVCDCTGDKRIPEISYWVD